MKKVALLCSYDRHYTRDMLKLSECMQHVSNYTLYLQNLHLDTLDVGTSYLDQTINDLSKVADEQARLLSAQEIDGIVSTGDYPGSILAAIIANKLQLPAPSVAAMLKCNHKFYARELQKTAVPEAVPDYKIVDPITCDPYTFDMQYPFFLKPVKAFFSIHANKVETPEHFAELLQHSRLSSHFLAPFDSWLKEYTDSTYGAHCLIAESLLEGHQTTVEGFIHNGSVTIIGIVDSIMFDNNISFKRFEYPSSLPQSVQERMAVIAQRCMQATGLDSILFNIEMMYNPKLDTVHIIEINPRMAPQFADLYQRVDGTNSYEILLAVATGTQPELKHRQGPNSIAASCVLRIFENKRVTRVPSTTELAKLQEQFPGIMIELYAKEGGLLSDQVQDGKSYRYGLVNLGACDRQKLLEQFEEIKMKLDFGFEAIP